MKALAGNSPRSKVTYVSTDVFLDAFYAQALSVRTLNDTEKTIIARAIALNCVDAQSLGEELNLPRSTAYHVVKHCFMKLHLDERRYLKQYCLGLEPILLFFLHMREEDAVRVDQYFRTIPYFYNEARLLPPGKEQSGQDDLTLLISLWFPRLFTHKLMTRVKHFTATHGFPGVHWFRYDRFHHGFALRRFGIDVETSHSFNLRGGVVANRVALQQGDLAILGQRLITRPARPLREVARATGFSIKRAFAAKKRLLSELIAGKDVSVLLEHFLSVREFRLLIRTPTPDEVAYFRTAFPEHYCFCDVNDQELHVLLLVPDGQTRDLEAFVAERAERVVLAGFNRGPLYSHIFNLADLETEYDYANNEWKDPFHAPDRWQWIFQPSTHTKRL